ncbi:hypothetical protein MSG28_013528 [Choristoneura fumiferana]|uniref:Uncharacterized protein n=1 Tax=Choristoneura fumiferana TaxID=7141 RepID=A0ACC0K7Z5_CHOFU|nr:hypothetical protein MSG28_013528 [Choristoneura fumiferana]
MNDSAAECSETLDPRVQIELERLNTATDEINRLEVELDEARLVFRRLLAEGHLRIQQLTKKLGTSVHKARPYYEARFRANITSQELQAATITYDKANSAHAAAREMVFLAEQGLARLAAGSDGGVTLDPAWQEMLNHATHRVNQAECERASATVTQRSKAAAHRAAAALVHQLQSSLKRHIAKSRPYFEEKARINAALEGQKARIQALEVQVADAKQQYSSALRNLERISDEIHKHRSRRQSARNAGSDIDRASTTTDAASDTSTIGALEELCDHSADASVREWLRRAAAERPERAEHPERPERREDTWTEIDLDYSSPEEATTSTYECQKKPPPVRKNLCREESGKKPNEVSFEKCSLRPRSSPEAPSPPGALDSKVSAASPRRIIRSVDRSAALRAELEKGRRQSLDALFHDTGEKVKEMFQGQSRGYQGTISRSVDRSAALRAELEKGRRQSLDALFHDTGEKVKEMFQGQSRGYQGTISRSVDRSAALRAELEKGRRQSLDALFHDTGEKVKEMFQGQSRGYQGTISRSVDRSAALRAELEKGRRQSLDALFHDTGEKVKEMFQGLSLFGERGSSSAPRTPRRSPPRARRSHGSDSSQLSDDRHSDTDSLYSVEMLTDDQIASLMLDAQLEAVCERLAGVASRQPQSPEARY